MINTILKEDVHTVSEFKENSTSFISQVKTTHRPILLTEQGESSAILLDIDEYERLTDIYETLNDIKSAQEDITLGRTTPHDKAMSELLARYDT